MSETYAKALRARIDQGRILAIAGVYDGVSALLARQAGFEAAYLSGYGVSASLLGRPDIGLVCYSEIVERVGSLASVIGIPLLCDADSGFGGPANIRRTVQGFERAGAAAIQIEDQDSPRRCGHRPGKRVVDRSEMQVRIGVAAETRTNPDTIIIARTDAIATHGLDEALTRLDLALEAGADIVFADAVESEEGLARIACAFPDKAMANIVPGGLTPTCDTATLSDMGFALAIFPSIALVASAGAIRRAFTLLTAEGRAEGADAAQMDVDDLHRIVGFDEIESFEASIAGMFRG